MAPFSNRQLGPKLFSSKVEGKETMWKNQAGIVGNSRKNFRPLSLPTSYSHEKSFHITTGPESNFEMMDSSKSPFLLNPSYWMELPNNYAKTFQISFFWDKNAKRGTKTKRGI